MRSNDRDPAAVEAAYATIGRLLVTWASIDQTVTRSLWRRDRTNPFPPPVPSHFPGRLNEWGKDAQLRWPAEAAMTWEEFERHQAEALAVRNALAHWVVDVHGHAGRFSVAVQPHEPSGWSSAFDRWWRRVKHMPPLERHPGPARGQVTRWSDWQMQELQLRWDALNALTTALDRGEWADASDAVTVLTNDNHTTFNP